jgi:hypothetical protein
MTLSTAHTTAAAWVERYETLRRYVLSGPALQSEPLSLVLWLAHGMAGWMRHWEKEIECVSETTTMPPPRCPATPLWQQQLTNLLAQMTAQHLQCTL